MDGFQRDFFESRVVRGFKMFTHDEKKNVSRSRARETGSDDTRGTTAVIDYGFSEDFQKTHRRRFVIKN